MAKVEVSPPRIISWGQDNVGTSARGGEQQGYERAGNRTGGDSR
jgi:hypothetical protein